jgi:hypothetical protein
MKIKVEMLVESLLIDFDESMIFGFLEFLGEFLEGSTRGFSERGRGERWKYCACT